MWASTQVPEDSARPLNPGQPVPQPGRHRDPMTVLQPQSAKASKRRKTLIIVLITVVILGILATTGYFLKRLIESKYYFCRRSVKFIPLAETCDGKEDCIGGEDELICPSNLYVNATFPVRLNSADRVLQVYSTGSGWRSVCSDDWTEQHTQTACTQLGYTNNPQSTEVRVSTLSSLRSGPFTAVRSGTSSTSIDKATTDLNSCKTGSVISLTCSDCGKSANRDDRIVGGTDAIIENWPWQVSLRQNGQHTCGGTLVSPRWVVTAAHCFPGDKKTLSLWSVVSGYTNLALVGGTSVDKLIINSDYNEEKNDYDIAMMRLSSPITVGESSRPACLPPTSLNLPDQTPLFVTGWGLLKENGKVSNILQKAEIKLIGRSTCSSPQIYGYYITQRMICAGNLMGGVDACQGDSGGPLVYSLNGIWNLVGVVSWGVGCAEQNKPGVYTNVDEMLNWIYTVMEKNP